MKNRIAVDPVCGNEVNTADAQKSYYLGRTYYFDSPGCKSRFENNPAFFARRDVEKIRAGEGVLAGKK